MNLIQAKPKLVVVVVVALAVIIAGLGVQWSSNEYGVHFQIPTAAQASDTYYTCPMHPTIVQDKPGTCPICGMDLVPKQAPGSERKTTAASGDHKTHGEEATSTTDSLKSNAGEKQGKRKIKYWVAPMDPTYIRDEPEKSPMGMDLIPVYEDEKGAGSSSGVIKIDPVMVQNMGVRVVEVRRGSISRKVRTLGEVEVAEDQLSVVNLRFSGWIEKIYADETGQKVRRGQALFSIYSPELVSAQKEYLLAYNTSGKNSDLTKAAADRILLWDIPRSVLDKVVTNQNVDRNLIIRTPRSGFILHKNVVEGARIKAGSDLYRIGNLQKIWVNAEVYEFDAPWIRVGQKATMELSFQQGRTFQGSVNYIYPMLNKKSRTLKVRIEFPNPGIALKPGMFATVRIEAQRKDNVLVIPTEAIIHSGERQIVFVTKKIGRYEPREIVTGLAGDDRGTEVLLGLKDGETVVTSGQFLLDSESQLQEAVQKLLEARLQAKKADPKALAAEPKQDKEDDQASSYWTCGMHPNIVQDGPGTCPICGMDLVEKKR